jgi:hypothetical protein
MDISTNSFNLAKRHFDGSGADHDPLSTFSVVHSISPLRERRKIQIGCHAESYGSKMMICRSFKCNHVAVRNRG